MSKRELAFVFGRAYAGMPAYVMTRSKHHPEPYIRPSVPFQHGQEYWGIKTTLYGPNGEVKAHQECFRNHEHAHEWLQHLEPGAST